MWRTTETKKLYAIETGGANFETTVLCVLALYHHCIHLSYRSTNSLLFNNRRLYINHRQSSTSTLNMPVVHHYLNDHDDWHGLRSLQSLSLDAQGDPTDGFAADSSPTAASEQAQSQLDPSTAPLTISAAASASPLAGNRTEHKSAAVSTEHDVDATNSVDPGRGSGVDSTGADTSLVATPTDPALPNSRPSLPLALSADARMSAFGPSHLPFFFSPPASVFSSAPSTLSTIPTSLPVSSLPSESTPSSTSDSPSVSPSSEADASHKSFTGTHLPCSSRTYRSMLT